VSIPGSDGSCVVNWCSVLLWPCNLPWACLSKTIRASCEECWFVWTMAGGRRNMHNVYHILNSVLLLLVKRYNLFKVSACSTTFFYRSLSCATFLQLRRFILFISSKTSSSQRNLGLALGLLDMGCHLLTFFTLLSSFMRSTWLSHFNLCFLINPIMFCPFSVSLISWLVLILQQPSSNLIGPNIFLMIFLSKIITLNSVRILKSRHVRRGADRRSDEVRNLRFA
jgi:hypothetical protein